jgi:hypothetical protein
MPTVPHYPMRRPTGATSTRQDDANGAERKAITLEDLKEMLAL